MDVRTGYKMTEVGVIPEDWEVQCLLNLVSTGPKNGYSGRSAKDARGTPTLSLGATSSGALTLNDETVKRLEETISTTSDLFLRSGDVLVQRSNTIDLVGTTALFEGPSGVYVYPDLMMRMRFREETTAHWFWRYANSAQGRRYFMRVAAGSSGSMPKITGETLRGMRLPLPPLSEQRAISAALSDADALLGALDQLIAKKRDLKQAAMQRLLTGRARLPGFHGEWEVKPARQIGVFRGGSGFPLDTQGKGSGTYPFFKVSDMNSAGNDTFMTGANHWISEQTRKRLGASVFPADSIVFAKVGAAIFLERKRILRQPSCIDNNLVALVLDRRQADVCFVHTLLLYKKLGDLVATTALPALNTRQLGEMVLSVPPLPEQTAIAAVLSDMDAELSALKARRDKTRALKQAMMQELLTGRTRLV